MRTWATMRAVRWLSPFAFLVAVAVGGLCLVHGLGYMAGFNTTPLLSLVELARDVQPVRPALGMPPAAISGRVTLVVVDGLRADFAPLLGLYAPPSVPTATCQLETVLPSFSRPAYVALSTGVPPWASGVQTNDHKGPARLPSIWDIARKAGVHTHLVADGTDWWTDLFPDGFDQADIVPRRYFDVMWNGLGPEPQRSVLLVHIVAADDEAHDHGTHDEYRREIVRAGQKIQSLLARLDPTRDTLMVIADHGHIARGGHGGPEPETMTIPFLAFGAGVVPSPVKGDGAGGPDAPWCGSILDIPVAVAARLDLPPPPAGLGTLPPIIVPAGPDFTAMQEAQSIAVHDKLGGSFDPIGLGRARALQIRGMALGVTLWLALVWLLARAFVVGSRWRAVVSALVPGFLFIATYWIVEPALSLSAVWLEGPWTVHMALLSAAVAVVACLIVFRRHAPGEALLLFALGAALPFVAAAFAHGSLSAGPMLGEAHAAFALVASDLFAGVAIGVAALATFVALWLDRRRARDKVWV